MTSLAKAAYVAKIGSVMPNSEQYYELPPLIQIQRLERENARLRSEVTSQSKQIENLVLEIQRIEQLRRWAAVPGLTMLKIIEAVAEEFEVTPKNIINVVPCRIGDETEARKVVYYLAKELTHMKLVDVARYMKRDHSTVHHALASVAAKRKTNAEYDAKIVRVIAELDAAK